MYVGANWLTRDNTEMGMVSILNYFDAIFKSEGLPPSGLEFIILGYSQGVSVALRYMAKRKIQCNQIILHSGGIPKELKFEDFEYLNYATTVKLIYGTKDEYLNEERMKEEIHRATELFGNRLVVMPFEGTHIVNTEILNDLVQ
jgi:predicted esterase